MHLSWKNAGEITKQKGEKKRLIGSAGVYNRLNITGGMESVTWNESSRD